MKKSILVFIFLTGMLNIANAQWQQALGDYTTGIDALAVTGSTVFAGGNGCPHMWMSSDNGNTWTWIDDNGLTYSDVITALAIKDTNIYAGSANGVYLSTDNGASWNELGTGMIGGDNYAEKFLINGTNMFAATVGGVYLSTDNGITWQNKGLSDVFNTSLVISDTNIFAGSYSYGVYLSNNNGTSWTQVNTGLTNQLVNALLISGNNIFAGTKGGGVFRSNNNGTSWISVNTGLANLNIYSFVKNGTDIYAGAGNGVYLSTNNGTSWTAVNTGLTNTAIRELAVNNINMIAATDTFGIWIRPLSELTGIEERILNNSISVYPNPAKDNLTIETKTGQSLEIINLVGQTVYTTYIYNKATINTSAFPSGVYILKLYTDKETVVRKFVKE